MSPPTESVRKAPPVVIMISTNQGATIARVSARPENGLSRASQRQDRSFTAKAVAAKAGNIGVIGPLTRMPTPSAAQNRNGKPDFSPSPLVGEGWGGGSRSR